MINLITHEWKSLSATRTERRDYGYRTLDGNRVTQRRAIEGH